MTMWARQPFLFITADTVCHFRGLNMKVWLRSLGNLINIPESFRREVPYDFLRISAQCALEVLQI